MHPELIENKGKGLYLISSFMMEKNRFKLTYLVKNKEAEEVLEKAFTQFFGFITNYTKGQPYLIEFLVNERNTFVTQPAPKVTIGVAVEHMIKNHGIMQEEEMNCLTEWVRVVDVTKTTLVLRDKRHDGALTFRCDKTYTPQQVLKELKHAVHYGDMSLRLKGKSEITLFESFDFSGNVQLKDCKLRDPVLENCILNTVIATGVDSWFKMCEVSDWVVPGVCGELSLSYGLYKGSDILHASRIVRIMDRKVN